MPWLVKPNRLRCGNQSVIAEVFQGQAAEFGVGQAISSGRRGQDECLHCNIEVELIPATGRCDVDALDLMQVARFVEIEEKRQKLLQRSVGTNRDIDRLVDALAIQGVPAST